MSISIVWTRRNGSPELFLGSAPVEAGLPVEEPQVDASICVVRIEFYSFLRRPPFDCDVLARFPDELAVCVGQPVIRWSESRIGINRLLEIFSSFLQFLLPRTFTVAVQMISSLKVSIEGFRVYQSRPLQRHLLLCHKLSSYFAGNFLRHVSLQPEYVTHIPFIAVRPQMFVRWTMNKLCRDPHAIAGALHGAFDNSVHV